ncbi:hypothetical protein [Methylocystis parvus]|uniref:hypothetical protein n=1 Tax=Methylocystis parvus TaxID=134 RepID=UPI003C716791
MTYEFQESGASPQRSAIVIWRIMSIGPIVYFLWLLSFGVELLAASQGWWTDMPSDLMIFGPIFTIIIAQIAGVIFAYRKCRDVAGTPFETHATSAIRTFWIMVAGFAVSVSLCLMLLMVPNIGAIGFGVGVVVIMLATLPLLFLWESFRVVRGLRRAMSGKSVADHPTRWS